MQVFVAGGTGVIGRLIVPLLLAGGHEVTVMARDVLRAEQVLPEGARVARGDVFDAEQVTRAMAGATPDVVMHQLTDLSRGNSAANAQMRTEGTKNLVDAASRVGVGRMVVQSISWCYEPGVGPASEDVPLDLAAESPDRRTTVEAVNRLEHEASRLPESVVLRNGVFYGPGTWYWPHGMVADLALAGRLPATPAVTSFVHVEDAARAAVAALAWPAGVVNVVDDEPVSGLEWAPVFAEAVGGPEPHRGDAAQPWERGASNARARHLGWIPQWDSWRSGFAAAASSE